MNKLNLVSAAGALALGAVGAHASIALPSSGSSDAILFAEVVNAAGTAAVASYAGDTGVSISSIIGGPSGPPTVLERHGQSVLCDRRRHRVQGEHRFRDDRHID